MPFSRSIFSFYFYFVLNSLSFFFFFDGWKKSEYPKGTHACRGITCKLKAERDPSPGFKPGPSCYKATVLLTATLWSQ